MNAALKIAVSVIACALALGPWAAQAVDAPPAAGPAASPQARFADGNRHYLEGRYGDALKTYAALHEELRIEDPVLYHNLGNACFRAEAYGSAILYYQRALRLDPPSDVADSLAANLDAARRTLQGRYRADGEKSQFVFAEAGGLVYKATHLLGRTPLAVLFAVFWTTLFLLLILRRLLPEARLFGRAALTVGLAATLIGLLLWGQVYTDAAHRVGVVVVDGAKLRDGKHRSAQGKDIPEGLEVRIVERDGEWTRVELNSGRQGWIEDAAVRQI